MTIVGRAAVAVFIVLCCVLAIASPGPNGALHPQYHASPMSNWMNDPNGPVFYKGYYHLFFQYNPFAAIWGNMSWGHVVSTDLVRWKELPIALYNDQWYDVGGVFSGSITLLQDGTPVIAYTCVDAGGIERQCTAYPSDPSDSLLLNWTKSSHNPVIADPPPNCDGRNTRDDTTAWMVNGMWMMALGTKYSNASGTFGAVILYQSPDFVTWTSAVPQVLYSTTMDSMIECPDLFPLASESDPNLFGLKLSMQGKDWFVLGDYDVSSSVFTATTSPSLIDPGSFYASKRFYDPQTGSQILFGWSPEDDSNGLQRGWQGVQTLPRELVYHDQLNMLLQIPRSALASLQQNCATSAGQSNTGAFSSVSLTPVAGLQGYLDLNVTNLDPSGNNRFIVRLRASSDASSTYTDVIMDWNATSSSQAPVAQITVDRTHALSGQSFPTHVASIPLLGSEAPSAARLQIFLDHNMLEVYAMGGRAVVTAKIYSAETYWNAFTSYAGSGANVAYSLVACEMASAWS